MLRCLQMLWSALHLVFICFTQLQLFILMFGQFAGLYLVP